MRQLGGTSTNVNQQGGSSNGSSSPDVSFLEQIVSLLFGVFGIGQSQSQLDLFTFTTHAKAYSLYNSSKPVKKAIIQNITNTDVITVFAVPYSTGKTYPVSNYEGIILNPASVANQGGGSLPLGNVDLSNFAVICDTTDALIGLAIYYEY